MKIAEQYAKAFGFAGKGSRNLPDDGIVYL